MKMIIIMKSIETKRVLIEKKGNGNLNLADAKLFETIGYGFRNPSKMFIARLV